MNALEVLQRGGQSIWLDSISRELLDSGTLARYREELFVTGLTSNPTIFQRALSAGDRYDDSLRARARDDRGVEAIFFGLALEDLGRAAELFQPAFSSSDGRDGFVSLEVSPTLADDATATIEQARRLSAQADLVNLLVKVPGTRAGERAIEELTAEGVAVNVTLLFSREHYVRAAEAWMRGIERRVQRDLDPDVPSVASLFVSRWDAHTASQLPPPLANRLGIAVAQLAYQAYRELLASPRWQRLERAGARPQRLLWGSTGTKDPSLPESWYVTALAAEGTVNTMPEKTLLAFAERGEVKGFLGDDAAEARRVLAEVRRAGVDTDALAETLQREGRDAFVDSWNDLLGCIDARLESLRAAS